jgi:hypothetical protein
VTDQDQGAREGETLQDEFYMTGTRTQRAFMLLEGELDALTWAPWWVRRRMVKRVKAQTKFKDCDAQTPPSSLTNEPGEGI